MNDRERSNIMTEEKVLLVADSTTVHSRFVAGKFRGESKEGGREGERNREKLCTSLLDKGY